MLDGLIDTGADGILASDLLAEQLEVDLSASRFAQAIAVEDRDVFDRRFGIVPMG